MSAAHWVTPYNLARNLDVDRCAALHNEIYWIGRNGMGQNCSPTPGVTWWEHHTPTEEVIKHLNPDLVAFLKLAYIFRTDTRDNISFFYWLDDLAHPRLLFTTWVEVNYPHRYDQERSLAAFIGHTDDLYGMCTYGWGFKPLEIILSAYLDMIREGKVSTTDRIAQTWEGPPDPISPWIMRPYTQADVEKAVSAMQGLVAAIKSRLPIHPSLSSNTWSDFEAAAAHIPSNTFIFEFLKGISTMQIPFHYLAPGIRLPSPAEFSKQPFLPSNLSKDQDYPLESPLLLFYTDGAQTAKRGIPLLPESPMIPTTPAGLYMSSIQYPSNREFSNGCYLLLPFNIGQYGRACTSDNQQMGVDACDTVPKPKGMHDDLYQSGYNGFVDLRHVQLHKVLQNWASNIENGHWEVGEDGVVGGIERFQDADTEDHWEKYWVPPSW
ncbi:hypothetical protein APSETT444_005205 [Aspergillus pseudonomiae]